MDSKTNQLEQIKKQTIIVADTGDFDSMKEFKPEDSTTNPSLILQAVQIEQYKKLVTEAVNYTNEKLKNGTVDQKVSLAADKLAVLFGQEILKLVPGLVSTELDARLSFDTKKCIEKAHQIIALYEEAGIKKERILIKIASTWEGLQACKVLEQEGIHCNLTLLFSLAQAAVAADVGATLISPFVGRITDWFKKSTGKQSYPVEEDPGVLSVRAIYNYYKCHGYKTVVMGASFRTKEQVLALAGCDKLTVAPKWLKAMTESTEDVPKCLDANKINQVEKIDCSESGYRWLQCKDAMATEKLAEGIRAFAVDTEKLEAILKELF